MEKRQITRNSIEIPPPVCVEGLQWTAGTLFLRLQRLFWKEMKRRKAERCFSSNEAVLYESIDNDFKLQITEVLIVPRGKAQPTGAFFPLTSCRCSCLKWKDLKSQISLSESHQKLPYFELLYSFCVLYSGRSDVRMYPLKCRSGVLLLWLPAVETAGNGKILEFLTCSKEADLSSWRARGWTWQPLPEAQYPLYICRLQTANKISRPPHYWEMRHLWRLRAHRCGICHELECRILTRHCGDSCPIWRGIKVSIVRQFHSHLHFWEIAPCLTNGRMAWLHGLPTSKLLLLVGRTGRNCLPLLELPSKLIPQRSRSQLHRRGMEQHPLMWAYMMMGSRVKRQLIPISHQPWFVISPKWKPSTQVSINVGCCIIQMLCWK